MKVRKFLNGLTLAVLASVVSSPAFAVIDVTGATGAITEGTVAVTAIILALVAAYGTFLGLRMAYRAVKRG